MQCPACGDQLVTTTIEGIELDICKNGCAGIWFDNYELEKMDEKHESVGEHLLQLKKAPNINIDYSQTRMCPKCENRKMLKHFVSSNMEIEVDECPECGGFWLDPGELGQIREQFETDADRNNATTEYFKEVFKDDLKQEQAETQETLKHIHKITNMFRFICPSYYIPGKQKWGAF